MCTRFSTVIGLVIAAGLTASAPAGIPAHPEEIAAPGSARIS